MKKIVIIWEVKHYADRHQINLRDIGYNVKVYQYFEDFISENEKPDLIIYYVDVVSVVDGKHKSGWRVGFDFFKENQDKINCPVIFLAETMFLDSFRGETRRKDEEFRSYIGGKHLCLQTPTFRNLIIEIENILED